MPFIILLVVGLYGLAWGICLLVTPYQKTYGIWTTVVSSLSLLWLIVAFSTCDSVEVGRRHIRFDDYNKLQYIQVGAQSRNVTKYFGRILDLEKYEIVLVSSNWSCGVDFMEHQPKMEIIEKGQEFVYENR